MANDTIEIIEPMEFHPTDTPRGCTYYHVDVLTECQQYRLNDLKLRILDSDAKYLRHHPEIRAFVALITRYVFLRRPRRDIPLMIKEFFNRPPTEIDDDITDYISQLPQVEEDESTIEEDETSSIYRRYLMMLAGEPVEEEKIVPDKYPIHREPKMTFIETLLDEVVDQVSLTTLDVSKSKKSTSTVVFSGLDYSASNEDSINRKTDKSILSSQREPTLESIIKSQGSVDHSGKKRHISRVTIKEITPHVSENDMDDREGVPHLHVEPEEAEQEEEEGE